MSICFDNFCNITNTTYSEIPSGEELNSEIGGLVAVAVAACVINGIVFLLFLLKIQLRTAPNYFLLSLAISDFSVGAVIIPMGLMKVNLLSDSNPEVDRYYPIVQGVYHVLEKFIAFSTVFHVTAITVERYLAVVKPMKHFLLRKSTTFRVILAIWFAAFGTSSIQFTWNLHEPQNDQEDAMQYLHERNFYIFCMVIIFVLPYIIMLYAYGSMFRTIFAARKSEQKYGGLRRHSTIRRRSDWKPLVIFLLLAVIFALCWLPWFSITLSFLSGGPLHPAAYTISALVRFLTPLANPIMYTVFKQDFKDALRCVIRGRVTPRRLSNRGNSNRTTSTKVQSPNMDTENNVFPLKTFSFN